MKIDKPYKPTIFAIISLFLLTLLPGYSPKQELSEIRFPINNANLALYHNFVVSGIYESTQESDLAIASISKEIDRIVALDARIKPDIRPDYSLKIKEFLQNAGIKLEEMFLFFDSPANFALILRGHFSLEFFASLFHDAEANDNSIKLSFKSQKSDAEFMAQIKPEEILFCPKPVFNKVSQRLESDEDKPEPKFKAFRNMLKGKPALAAEADLRLFLRNLASSSIRIPESLQQLNHIRLIADNQITKMQLSVPDENSRDRFFEQIGNELDSISRGMDLKNGLKIRHNGRSIFIEADADPEVERQLSQKFSALLIQFFLKKSFNQQIAAINDSRPIRK